jgi:hypothetical protein
LIAKAIEYITGSAIERDSIQFEANKIAFRYKGQKTFTDISQKLIEDTISIHKKSLEGRYADGGESTEFKKGGNVPSIEKRVAEVNALIQEGNEKGLEVIDKTTTWEAPMKYNSIKYTNGVLYISYKELDLYKNNKGMGREWKNESYKIGKHEMGENSFRGSAQTDALSHIARMYRSAINHFNKYGYADGGEVGFDDKGTDMVMYHETKGNFIIPKGQIYLWLYDGENIGEKLQNNEYDWVFYPYASRNMAWASDFIPPLKRIWTKKFQKEHKGSEHLLGVIKAFLIEENGKKELYIDMMSVNPKSKKKGIMSYMIKELRDTFKLKQDQVTFSDLTEEGEKFVAKKTYADGGEVGNNFQDINSSLANFIIWITNKTTSIQSNVRSYKGKMYFTDRRVERGRYNDGGIEDLWNVYLNEMIGNNSNNTINNSFVNFIIWITNKTTSIQSNVRSYKGKIYFTDRRVERGRDNDGGIEDLWNVYINEHIGTYADGGEVESKINELYSKSNFINNDFNWQGKLLEMIQDNSVEAYNIYQSLNEEQKEEVLQELYEMDNDMGSDGDGDIATSKENLEIILEDAKNGNKYAKGGDIPHEDKMFQLPLEMVVYVPSTQDVDKVISVDKMASRVNEVKEYLGNKFGGYSSADKLGGFVDSKGNLINEDVTQVTSFSTKEAFEENKEELVKQLAKWGKEWGQEAIGFEFEGDLMYVPQEI